MRDPFVGESGVVRANPREVERKVADVGIRRPTVDSIMPCAIATRRCYFDVRPRWGNTSNA